MSGYARFKASVPLIHEPTGTMISAGDYYATISRVTSDFSVEIPATDATTLSPLLGSGPIYYTVEVVVNRKVVHSVDCLLPKALTPVSVFELDPISVEDGGGIQIGQDPEPLTVVLTAGAAFNWTIERTDGAIWGTAPVLEFTLPNASKVNWITTVAGTDATFSQSAASVDALIAQDPESTRLMVGEVVWAKGGAPVVVQ